MAIVSAARELVRTGQPVTMPTVAQAALVSEPTAYRYFPDLLSLLTESFADLWPDPEQAMQPVAGSSDPAERVAYATEFLLRHVLACQGAVRAMIAATAGCPPIRPSRAWRAPPEPSPWPRPTTDRATRPPISREDRDRARAAVHSVEELLYAADECLASG